MIFAGEERKNLQFKRHFKKYGFVPIQKESEFHSAKTSRQLEIPGCGQLCLLYVKRLLWKCNINLDSKSMKYAVGLFPPCC